MVLNGLKQGNGGFAWDSLGYTDKGLRLRQASSNDAPFGAFLFFVCHFVCLGEGLALKVGDIDAGRLRVQLREARGNRDRLVPLPQATLSVLCRSWQRHRHPELLFPNRHAGLKGARRATSPLDRGGVQITLRKVAAECGLKKALWELAVEPPSPSRFVKA